MIHEKEQFQPEYFSGLNWRDAQQLEGTVVFFSNNGSGWNKASKLTIDPKGEAKFVTSQGYRYHYIKTCPQTHAHPTIIINGVKLPRSETDEPEGWAKKITLCGSTKFKKEFEQVMKDLTLQGHIVISVGLFGHETGLDMSGETKRMLDRLHFKKIDLSDEIYVVNPGGYIGLSTCDEIYYAIASGKPVHYMVPPHPTHN